MRMPTRLRSATDCSSGSPGSSTPSEPAIGLLDFTQAIRPSTSSSYVSRSQKRAGSRKRANQPLATLLTPSRLQPAPGTDDFETYQQWLHFGEGSAMLPMLLKLYVSRLGDAGAPLWPRIESEIANHLGYIEGALQGRQWLVGDDLSGADILMSFVGEVAGARADRSAYPSIDAWVRRFQQRPAYRKALERGGPYAFGG